MNRHQRRAAKASGNASTIDPVVAIHEAGHAVARILTAPDLGFSPECAITYIGSSCKKVGKRDGMMSM